jgi:hypothetical protein
MYFVINILKHAITRQLTKTEINNLFKEKINNKMYTNQDLQLHCLYVQ